MNIFTKAPNTEFMSHDDLNKHVLSQYKVNVYSIDNIKFKDTDKQRAVYRINTDKGAKCLKKVYYDKHTLLFIYSTIEWLNMKGIRCPRLIPSKEGVRFVEYNNNVFILTDWIDGRKCSYDNLEDIIHAAGNLGNLHKSSFGFTPITDSFLRVSSTDYYDSYSKHFKQLSSLYEKATLSKDKFSNEFIRNYEYNLNHARKSVNILSSLNFDKNFGDNVSTFSICHLDYVNKNLIFSNNGLYIIDFDNTKMDYPVHDIVYFLKRILRRKRTSWSFEIFTTAMNSYEEFRKLSYGEHLFILAALEFPHKFWKISRDYYKYNGVNNKDFFLKQINSISSQQKRHEEFCSVYKSYIQDRFGKSKLN
ncbi:CotS family spore coat protein [Clostridium cylindrosporum]|uniref:Spore coat protein I n=1 Tax=Clostridium cylindrosporum DSM 605 TaxID=1121307 RepID=A0A0J8D708_CLOCY|nr:CotS family spore coat protein [Clostridium cylindrosporum]KMT21662.1 spore coat protein I [Clostridium cylindrosporum DSM 605]